MVYPQSNVIKLQLTIWAMQNDLQEQCLEWISEIQSQKFGYINKSLFDDHREAFPCYCKIVYVLVYCEDIDLHVISKDCLLAFKEKDFSPKDRGYFAALQLINTSAFLGRLNRCINTNEISSVHVSDFCAILGQLLNYRDGINRHEVNGFIVETDLLNSIMRMYPKMDAEFQKAVDSMFSRLAGDYEHIEHLDIYWEHLKQHGQFGLLKQLYDNWMKPTGLVWEKELSEINEIATDFVEKAEELGWKDRAIETQKLLDSRIVGYVGRKDYSMYNLMNWYKQICIFDDSHWKVEGVILLNISKVATETGDNRAEVYIDASVAESAGRLSADDLWKFANLPKQLDFYWVGVIFDGIIAALEHVFF